MAETVAVIAAHPDDEVLGCGATIARHARAGDAVHVLLVAQGIMSRPNSIPEQVAELRACAERAGSILGVASLTFEDFPDNRMDGIDALDVTKRIEQFIQEHRPSTVYTHLSIDLNIDHVRVNASVLTACRPLPGSSVKRILLFEIPSSTGWRAGAADFSPNWFVDVSKTFDLKMKALGEYGTEMRPFPHARSLEGVTALARWRGASVGVESAEAFLLARLVVA